MKNWRKRRKCWNLRRKELTSRRSSLKKWLNNAKKTMNSKLHSLNKKWSSRSKSNRASIWVSKTILALDAQVLQTRVSFRRCAAQLVLKQIRCVWARTSLALQTRAMSWCKVNIWPTECVRQSLLSPSRAIIPRKWWTRARSTWTHLSWQTLL